MLLDIIIPHYKETEDKIKPLLDSINNQKDVDFGNIKLTIVNDCSDVKLSYEFLNSFANLDISFIRNDKNTGPGLARQKGIDNTDSDYIMFCDADDKLYDDKALFVIMDFISKREPNYLVTNIAVEGINNDVIIKKGNKTFPWMHGKVFKRQFLLDNEIRFSPNVRHLEDSYFTTCVIGSINPKEICYLDFTTYLWKNNRQSLTRNNNNTYMVDTFDDFFNSPIQTYEFLVKKNSYLKFSYLISSTLGIFIVLNSNIFDKEEYKTKKEFYINKLKEYVKKKKNIFVIFGKDKVNNLFNFEFSELSERNNITKMNKNLEDFYNEYLEIEYK